jgi:hypothetical protein
MTASTTFYLEHYLDSLEDLPAELKTNFSRMHDLDKRYLLVTNHLRTYLPTAKSSRLKTEIEIFLF